MIYKIFSTMHKISRIKADPFIGLRTHVKNKIILDRKRVGKHGENNA